MGTIMETTTQPCNGSITTGKLTQTQSLSERISLLSMEWNPMELFLSTLLFLLEQKRYQKYWQLSV